MTLSTGNDLVNIQVIVPVPIEGVTVQRALTVFGYDDAPHGHAEVGVCIVGSHSLNILILFTLQ